MALLKALFGEEYVFTNNQQPGSFALLRIGKNRVVLLYEWKLNGAAINFSYRNNSCGSKGSHPVLTRPQNKDYDGRPVRGGRADLRDGQGEVRPPIVERAEAELQSNTPSVDTMLLRQFAMHSFSDPPLVFKGFQSSRGQLWQNGLTLRIWALLELRSSLTGNFCMAHVWLEF